MFSVRRTIAGGQQGASVEIAFTDASVDLAEGEGRDPVRLDDQLRVVQEAIGVPVRRMHQVHGREVHEVRGSSGDVPQADALVSVEAGVALMTRAADCVPVVLADVERGIIGAVHSGRAGVELGVVPAAVGRMRDLGARDLRAWVGPHVCGSCYEVPEAMRAEVSALVPQTWSETSWGTPALDLGAGVAAQLTAAGVVHEVVGGCTVEGASLWSYRRDGERAGRLAGLVWVTS